jgi:hypothetical protein
VHKAHMGTKFCNCSLVLHDHVSTSGSFFEIVFAL